MRSSLRDEDITVRKGENRRKGLWDCLIGSGKNFEDVLNNSNFKKLEKFE